jgi:hypothetical protein
VCFDSQLGQESMTATPGNPKHRLSFYPYLFRTTNPSTSKMLL